MIELENIVMNATINLLRQAVTHLPPDIEKALRKYRRKETSEIAKRQLDAILANIELGEKSRTPLCQDTGLLMFHLRVGSNFPILDKLPQIIRKAVKKATNTIPLRPNAVDPFTRENSGDNTGDDTPHMDWEVVGGDNLELTVLPVGFGSEMMSALSMLTAGEGMKGIRKFVVDTVIKAGARPCPPIILGVGVGGGADSVMRLARKAFLRPIDEHHNNSEIARLEEELLELINETGIGPMGLGGKTTALGVNIEYAHTHTAGLPLGIIMKCWCARQASVRVSSDGRVEYLTNRPYTSRVPESLGNRLRHEREKKGSQRGARLRQLPSRAKSA